MGVTGGLMSRLLDLLWGRPDALSRAIGETAGIFREHAEGAARRDLDRQAAALAQFAAEFAQARRGRFDRAMDAVNRLPRPALALGTLGLFVTAMSAPEWFAARMAGMALVPEPLWWLMGAVVSFYFGARHQVKAHEYRRALAGAAALALARGQAAGSGAGNAGDASPAPKGLAWDNPALDEWRAGHGG